MVIGVDGFIHQRIESLYVCDEYKLFFLTGQSNGTGRCAYIAVKSFHTMNEGARDEMRKSAGCVEDSRVSISANQGVLSFYDRITGTVSNVPWSELDPDVQMRLRGNFTDPFQKYAGNTPETLRDIAVSKPLSLKRTPSP